MIFALWQQIEAKPETAKCDPLTMIKIPFAYLVRTAREKAGLKQTHAADSIGMTPKRWNNLELGKRSPNQEELTKMEALLGPLRGTKRPKGIHRHLIDQGLRSIETAQPYFPSADRPSFKRYYAALDRCPQLVEHLTGIIMRRDDFEACDYLCDQIAVGSYLEAIHLLRLLAQGAKPALVAPAWLPSAPLLVNPETREQVGHRPAPCLILNDAFYLFQMSFQTPRIFTVDVLCWDKRWFVIEIDGEGHDFTNDAEREAAIGLPFTRYRASDLERLDLPTAA